VSTITTSDVVVSYNIIIMFTPGFVTIGHTVQKFKCYRQTHKDTQKHGDVKSLYCIPLSIPEGQSLSCSYYRTVCVSVGFICWNSWPSVTIFDVILLTAA